MSPPLVPLLPPDDPLLPPPLELPLAGGVAAENTRLAIWTHAGPAAARTGEGSAVGLNALQ